jgi:hypothetical protein
MKVDTFANVSPNIQHECAFVNESIFLVKCLSFCTSSHKFVYVCSVHVAFCSNFVVAGRDSQIMHVMCAQILKGIMSRMVWERARWLFRFWHRFTVTKKSERAGVEPPIHRPHLTEWDEWLWQHRRRKGLMRQARKSHRHFRQRFCFYWLRWHAARNIKMREAWKFAARVRAKRHHSTFWHHVLYILGTG